MVSFIWYVVCCTPKTEEAVHQGVMVTKDLSGVSSQQRKKSPWVREKKYQGSIMYNQGEGIQNTCENQHWSTHQLYGVFIRPSSDTIPK